MRLWFSPDLFGRSGLDLSHWNRPCIQMQFEFNTRRSCLALSILMKKLTKWRFFHFFSPFCLLCVHSWHFSQILFGLHLFHGAASSHTISDKGCTACRHHVCNLADRWQCYSVAQSYWTVSVTAQHVTKPSSWVCVLRGVNYWKKQMAGDVAGGCGGGGRRWTVGKVGRIQGCWKCAEKQTADFVFSPGKWERFSGEAAQ